MRRSIAVLAATLVFWGVAVAEEPPEPQPEETTEPGPDDLDPLEILVIGRRERDLIDSPTLESPGLAGSQSVVDSGAFERQGSRDIVDAQSYVPGAWVESRGRKVKQFFSVRGQRYPYPDYAFDGAWLREFHEMPYFFPVAGLERIEIMRSSSALLIGPGGMVGTVNLIPRTYTFPETTVETSYGSLNTSYVHADHGGVADGTSYAIGFGNRYTDGPEDENAREAMADLYARVVHSPGENLELSLNVFGLHGKRELRQAGDLCATKFREDLSRFDPYRAALVVAKAHHRASDALSSEVVMSLALRDHKFIGDSETATSETVTREHDYEGGISFVQARRLSERNILRYGGLYNRWVAPNGKRFYVGNRNDLSTYSLFAVDEHSFERVQLNAGYRLSSTHVRDYAAFNIDGSPSGLGSVTPVEDEWEDPVHTASFGAAYHVGRSNSLLANVAAGIITPRPGTLDVDLQDPGRETRWKLDLGLKSDFERLGEMTATLFYVRQQDAIVLSGQTQTIGSHTYELYLNRDQEQLGAELDFTSRPFGSGTRFFFNAVAMETRAEDGGAMKKSREIPQFIAGAGLTLERGDADFNLMLKFVSEYESTRFLPPASDPNDLGDFVDVSLSVGYRFGERKQHRAYVVIENATDDEYSTVNGYPDPGVRVSAGVKLKF